MHAQQAFHDETPTVGPAHNSVDLIDPKDRQYAMFLHLSSLAGSYMVLIGVVLPIALWMAKKDESPGIDRHGRAAINFTISYLIYAVVSAILCLVLIGFFLLAVWGVAVIVFPIIAAVKASDGKYWEYPLSIRFF